VAAATRPDWHDMIGKPVSLQLFVLCRNRPDFARQAIQSAMKQTVNRFEIVISDNSTDSSMESLVQSEFPDLEYRQRTGDLSVFDHLNQCLNEATTDYVCLFHDDDLLNPRYIECVLDAIGQYPDAAAISTNAWIAEDGKPLHLSFKTTGKTHFVHDARQLAAHYFSRHQPGIAPFPGYVYSTARVGELRFNPAGGKYSDVSWLLRVADRGGIVWIVEPLMSTRMHASNDSRQESIGDRLKLFAFFKKHVSTLGQGLIEDFRFFLYKKILDLDRKNLLALSPSRRRTFRAYMTRYRCLRFSRLDHHRFLLQKAKVRLVQRFRPRTFKYPHGAA
jgi:glycosyltransferase involved in cell wall biosynthesis